MKKLLLLFLAIGLVAISFAQTPASFNYQAVARDAGGGLVQDKNVSFRISILEGSTVGPTLYQETHVVTTNKYGLVNLSIGTGTIVTGTFASVNWGGNTFYLKVDMDVNGGSAYADMGVQQLLSVPYAMHAYTVEDSDNDTANEIQMISKTGSTVTLTKTGGSFTLNDDDPNNELQTVNKTGNNVTLSNGGGSFSVADGDDDDKNELQTINKTGDNVTLSNGGGSFSVKDADSDVSNEIQTLSLSGTNLSLSKGGGSVNIQGDMIEDADKDTKIQVEEGSDDDIIRFDMQGKEFFTMDNGRLNVLNTGESVFFGRGAGAKDNLIANLNIAIGDSALANNVTDEFNTAIGTRALYASTGGDFNTAIGHHALTNNTTGNYNTAVGNFPLLSNTSGSYNIALGRYALQLNTSGSDNIGIGQRALRNHLKNGNNIALGDYTMYQDTSGTDNIAMGDRALYNNRDGTNNIALGYNSLYGGTAGTGDDNIALGYSTMNKITTGRFNVALGREALYSITSGNYNISLGESSLYNNTSGVVNVALGWDALLANTSGSHNIAFGYRALSRNTSTNYEIAIGYLAMQNKTSGQYNVAMGYNSFNKKTTGSYGTAVGYLSADVVTNGNSVNAFGYNTLGNATTGGTFSAAIGNDALSAVTTGSRNTGLGTGGGNTITTGSYNNHLGYLAGSGNYSYGMALGSSSANTASYQVRVGASNITSIGGYRAWTNLSDARFKTNIQENVKGLEFIMALRPVTYNLDIKSLNKSLGHYDDEVSESLGNENNVDALESNIEETSTFIHSGFLAQEVETAANKVGYTFSGIDKPKNENDHYGLRYAEFVVPLVKGMQEQQSLIKTQNTKIETLTLQLAAQQKLLLELQATLLKLQKETP